MSTLQGKFTQTLYDIKGESLEESTGTFVLQRPGKFYWKTEQPYPQLLVSNQETIWLFDPDLEQVTVRPFSNDLQRTPALLLSEDVNKLRENFIIQRELVDTQQEKFTLIPKVSKGLFQQLSLVFIVGELQAFYLQDNLGQATHFTLREVERNLAVDAALFNFTPPPGVDVLND
jgi:outer membrane lipoprotein carrier protein